MRLSPFIALWGGISTVYALPARRLQPSEPVHHPGVENYYIIQYHEHVSTMERTAHERYIHSASRAASYRGIAGTFGIGSFQGYHAHLSKEARNTLQSSRNSHLIKSIVADAVVTISQNRLPTPDNTTSAYLSNTRTIHAATWGQARISHRRPNATSYTYDDGSPTVYHLDTGIQLSHTEFAGRDSYGQPRVRWGANFVPGSADTDEAGHGTHTAGTIAGVHFGIAPRTCLVALKVFDGHGHGSWGSILSALSWAAADAVRRNATGLSVVNMSLGGGFFQAANDAVAAVSQMGLTVVVSAGNAGENLRDTSPASCAEALTIGATDERDRRARFSNWGPGLDFFAPGVAVVSAGLGESNTETAVMSGTSQAAPHAAGLAAYLMALHGWHEPHEMRMRMARLATRGVVVNPGRGSANLLIYNGNSAFD